MQALRCSKFFMALPEGGLRSAENDMLGHADVDHHHSTDRRGPSFAQKRRERNPELQADIFVRYPVCIKGLGPYILRRDIMRLLDGFNISYTSVRQEPSFDDCYPCCHGFLV